MLKILRAIEIVAKNEPNFDSSAGDEIDYHKFSDNTLSLLFSFVFGEDVEKDGKGVKAESKIMALQNNSSIATSSNDVGNIQQSDSTVVVKIEQSNKRVATLLLSQEVWYNLNQIMLKKMIPTIVAAGDRANEVDSLVSLLSYPRLNDHYPVSRTSLIWGANFPVALKNSEHVTVTDSSLAEVSNDTASLVSLFAGPWFCDPVSRTSSDLALRAIKSGSDDSNGLKNDSNDNSSDVEESFDDTISNENTAVIDESDDSLVFDSTTLDAKLIALYSKPSQRNSF